MNISRKNFLKTATAGLALTAITGKVMGSDISDSLNSAKKLKEFGLQLYTLRDVLPKDPKGILKQVAAMGYTQIESFEGKDGMFWGMKNTEFKKYMDDLGMKIVSSHCNIEKDFERKADEAAEIGMKYLIDPYVGTKKDADTYKKVADKFNERGETCRKAGIRFAYHNHGYTFEPVEGQMPMDIFMKNTDPSLVDFELDIYWVVAAGEDPIKWFQKYPNRFRLAHIKDRTKGAPLSEENASCVLGQGSIDYPKIMKAAQKNGLIYSIVEQEKYEGTTSLQATRDNADYLKKFKF